MRFPSSKSPCSFVIVAGRTAIAFFLFPPSPLPYLRIAYLYCTRVYRSPSHGLVRGRQSSPLYPSFRLRAFAPARLFDGKLNYPHGGQRVSVAIGTAGVDLVELGEIAGNGR